MRILWLCVALIGIQPVLPGTAAQRKDLTFDSKNPALAPEVDWDGVDYSQLQQLILSRGLARSDKELERLLRFNLRFVYSNNYKRDRFLVDPKPQHFVETVARILELNTRMDQLIAQGRKLAVEPYDGTVRKKGRMLVGEISVAARRLRGAFQENFAEIHGTTYDVSFLKVKGQESFKFYVVQVSRINNLLSERLNDYFFNLAPGAVSVPEYQKASVNVLALAMIKLGELNQPRL